MKHNLCFQNCKHKREIGIYHVCEYDKSKPITKVRIDECEEYEEEKRCLYHTT